MTTQAEYDDAMEREVALEKFSKLLGDNLIKCFHALLSHAPEYRHMSDIKHCENALRDVALDAFRSVRGGLEEIQAEFERAEHRLHETLESGR